MNEGTFTIGGGEIISSSFATVDCAGDVDLKFIGGIITNSGEGYAVSAARRDNAIFDRTVFRSKYQGRFLRDAASPDEIWQPEGYIETIETVDGITYQCLTKQ